MKKFFFFIFLALLVLENSVFSNNLALAEENKVNIYFFYGSNCPHCAAESRFLNKLEQKYPEIDIKRYNAYAKENQELLFSLCEQCQSKTYIGSVPMLFIKSSAAPSKEKPIFILGFDNENGMGKEIETAIQKTLQYRPNDDTSNNGIRVPFLGNINASKYSLPALTVILGFLDGFNVCSLGALVFILGLVLAFRSRKKTLIFGSIFLLTTAISYGILMLLWYQLFMVLSPYIDAMNIVVGLIAIAGGIYFANQFIKFRKQGIVCETGQKSKTVSQLSTRLSETFKNNKNVFAVLGAIFLFAAIVTIIEFPCSAAVPVAYAGILSQAGLSHLQYIFYICLFVSLYLLDELVVFLVAFFTMKLWLTSQKATLWITLIEAIILSLLGICYLFSWLI